MHLPKSQAILDSEHGTDTDTTTGSGPGAEQSGRNLQPSLIRILNTMLRMKFRQGRRGGNQGKCQADVDGSTS